MRQIQILVPDDQYEVVETVLDEEEIDYVRQRAWRDETAEWLVSFPIPTDALGHVLGRLREAALDEDTYVVIGTVETANTPRVEKLRERFSGDFDPLTPIELRSKALDMSEDLRSFLAMILLSTLIAAAGLLLESPAVVVGSMVIAPIVGPVLTASVGATTGDRKMLLDSLWYQGAGIGVAIVGAWGFGMILQVGGFLSPALDLTSIDLIAVRIAPGVLSVVVGLASGGAAAYGLATKGPTSLIGVMIAAALIPSAATVGLATAWSHPRIALGSFLLVALTLVLVNLAAVMVLWRFGYGTPWSPLSHSLTRPVTVAVLFALVLIVALTAGVTIDQSTHERTLDRDIQATLDEPAYDAFELVSVQYQYHRIRLGEPETITVIVSQRNGGEVAPLANDLDTRIAEQTEDDVVVRVRMIEYTYPGGEG